MPIEKPKKVDTRTKCIVKPKTSVTLLTPFFETVHHNRPSLVIKSDFIDEKLHDSVIKSLATDLPMSASDDDFKKLWLECEKDDELAIESFCATFGQATDGTKIEVEVEVEETSKGKKDKK